MMTVTAKAGIPASEHRAIKQKKKNKKKKNEFEGGHG
jgi:hypothetical protein